MASTTLRSLAKAYAKKNLETAAYRESRAKFINGVLAGENELTVNDYPPLIRPKGDEAVEVTVRRESKKKIPRTESKPQQPDTGSRNLVMLAVVAALVLVVIVIAVFLLAGGNSSDVTATSNPQVQTATPAKPNEAQLLVRDLLSQRNWNADSNMAAFIEKWQALPADTRASSMQSLELNQLTTAIYKQLLKERALSGIGDEAEARDKQQQLIDFAKQIGIDDPRLTIPE